MSDLIYSPRAKFYYLYNSRIFGSFNSPQTTDEFDLCFSKNFKKTYPKKKKMKTIAATMMMTNVLASSNTLMEMSSNVPSGFKWGERANSETIELIFAVKQQNLDKLTETLMEVSDPDSPSYGHHLSNDEVHELVRPSKEDSNTVESFLREQGFEPVSLTPNSDFLQIDVTVEEAEILLNAEYRYIEHEETGVSFVRTSQYSLPEEVADAVDFVSPTVHVPSAPGKLIVSEEAPLLGNSPKRLRELYSVDVEGKAANNSMAVTAFLNQKYSKGDLHEFWNLYCSGITCGKGDPKLVGDETSGLGGVESMLDIQSITGVAGNIHAEFWGFSGNSPDSKSNEPFMKWLTQMSNTSDTDIPKLFSTSYGEDEKSWSLDAAKRLNVEFQKAGARGITLLFASGDSGANCESGRFEPQWPSSSPYITAVGGSGGSSTEVAIGLSSGGFSDRWDMPSYQKDAVSEYLSNAKDLPDQKSSGYNTSGRAYPDIAAQGQDFTVVVDRVPMPGVAGTSCASPTASGVIALLNDLRLQNGESTLGFLNPWLYKNMDKWNDITSGSSGGGCSGIGGGWPAAKGWDAVTGVGTPNYKNLATVL